MSAVLALAWDIDLTKHETNMQCIYSQQVPFPEGGPPDFDVEALIRAGLKPVNVSGKYLITAFLDAVKPYLKLGTQYIASLTGKHLTADHTFK